MGTFQILNGGLNVNNKLLVDEYGQIITQLTVGSGGGFAYGHGWKINGNYLGQFGLYGSDTSANYFYFGTDYLDPWVKIEPNGKLHAKNYIKIGTDLEPYDTNRAELSVVSSADSPGEIWLGTKGSRVWSISARHSETEGRISFFSVDTGHIFYINKDSSSYLSGCTFANGIVTGSLSGNASTATKLQTARTISLTGSVTGSGSFDGSGNLSIATTTNHSHSYLPLSGGQMSGPIYMGSTATTDGPSIVFFSNKRNYIWMGYANDNGSWYIWDSHNSKGIIHSDVNGNNTFFGNAASASKLAIARTISLTGSVTGSGSFDGSGNLSISTTTNHNHDSVYVKKREDGTSYTQMGTYYAYGNTAAYVRIALPVYSGWDMCQMEFSIRQTYGSGNYGKLTLYAYTSGSSSNWTQFYAVYHDRLTSSIKVYGSDSRYFYIAGISAWGGLTLDKVVFGDAVTGADMSAIVIDGVSTLPSTYQTAAMLRSWVQGDSITGAVWNDYAEYRESDCKEFGRVLIEKGDDSLTQSTERLQHFAGISSDTWGFCQGETEKAKTPIAVAGRVLAYPYQDRDNYKPGDCVCAAPGGTVDIMTREEVRDWPDRIIGTVSCVPDYKEWGSGDRDPVKVNGRIWIKVK